MNRYGMERRLKEFINSLSAKYGISSKILVTLQKHFCDSALDREVPFDVISHIVTYLIRNRMVECLYLFHTNANIIIQHKRYTVPVTVKKTDSKYVVTLRTIYPERNPEHRVRIRDNTQYIIME